MNRRRLFALLGAALCTAPGHLLAAGSRNIDFDTNADFAAFRTFAIRDGRIDSHKPELNNRLFRQRVNDSIRATLTGKRLQEVSGQPDLWVSFHFTDADFSTVQFNVASRVPDAGGIRGFVIPGSGPNPVLFTEGTLVIDMHNAAGALVWRGTHRERARSAPVLSGKLSGNARQLLLKYPRRKK